MATTKKTYGPMKDSSPPAAFQAYVDNRINQVTDRLTQVHPGGGRGGRGGGRGDGPGRGRGGRGDGPNRPRHMSVSSGDTGDAATNKKVNDLVKAYIAQHGTPEDDEDHHVKDNDEIVAKYCNKCKRWNKGNKLHYTRECNRADPAPPAETTVVNQRETWPRLVVLKRSAPLVLPTILPTITPLNRLDCSVYEELTMALLSPSGHPVPLIMDGSLVVAGVVIKLSNYCCTRRLF